jgi:hypothetical protein
MAGTSRRQAWRGVAPKPGLVFVLADHFNGNQTVTANIL